MLLMTGCGFILFSSCFPEQKKAEELSLASAADTIDLYEEKAEIKYAKGFEVEYHGTYKSVVVFDPANKKNVFGRYVLVEKGNDYTSNSDEQVIEIPISTIACVSTTHLPFLTILNEEEKLTGFAGIKYIRNKRILERVKKGLVKEIGRDYDLNKEDVIDLSPQTMMVYPYEGMNFGWIKKAGIQLIYNTEYLELSPLGKAEWIKFVALFFNKEKEAEEYFTTIEEAYLSLKRSAEVSSSKPTIFSGKAFNGEWHVPGGKSFAAAFMNDAGGTYCWKADEHNNVLNLSFEQVTEAAMDAEWWLIVGAHNGKYDLEQLAAEDDRYRAFRAFKNKQVLFCNTFSNDYFGDGVAEPHIILKDIMSFIRPDVVKKHQPVYFQLLQ